jgi:predicted Zn-dependent peptidase
MIGGSMSSRMSLLLREQNGLTYESQCSTDYLQIGGEFTIYAVTDPTKFMANGKKKGVFPLLIDLVKQLLKSGVTQEELDTAKGNFKGELLIQQEKITNTAEYNGLQCAIYPDESFVPYSDIYASCYDKITLKEVNETIKKYLKYSNMYISTIGKKGSHDPSLEQMKIVCRDINIPIYK